MAILFKSIHYQTSKEIFHGTHRIEFQSESYFYSQDEEILLLLPGTYAMQC